MSEHFGSPTQANQEMPQAQPTPEQNQQSTEAMPWYTKAAKALAFGSAQIRTKDIDTLRKTGAVSNDLLDARDRNTEGLRKFAGIENYDPASAHFADSSKPWTERIGYLPRTLLEGTPEMAQHIAASTIGGPLGMLGSTALAHGGEAVNTVRQSDNTDPNTPLTPQQKLRVAGDVGIQAALNEIGGRATLGATAPVKGVGMQAVKQAGANVAKAAATDAAVGAYGAGVDKALLEGKEPSMADLALPGLAGAAVGTAFRAPGAARDAAVATRFRSLGNLEPQSRGEVADTLGHYKGNFEATQKHFVDDLAEAKKGLDADTHDILSKAKIEYDNGQRISPDKIEAASKADPEAGRVLRNLDTLGVMRSLDNGGLSGSFLGRLLNPYQTGSGKDIPTSLGKFAEGASLGHMFWAHDPATAAAVFGTQLGGTAGLKAIDALTGASNPSKVITDKFGGTAEPTQTVAQARAAARAQAFAQNDFRKAAELHNAQLEKTEALSDKQSLDNQEQLRAIADRQVKAESSALWKTAVESLRARRNSDQIKANDLEAKVSSFQDKAIESLDRLDKTVASEQLAKDAAMARQASLMRNSQAVEEARLKAEQKATKQADTNFYKQQRERLAIRTRSDIPASEYLGQDLGFNQNVPLPELVSSDTRLALAVAKLNRRAMENAEPQGPTAPPTSTPVSARPELVKTNMRWEEIKRKAEAKRQKEADKQNKVAAKAKAAKRVKDAEAKVEEKTIEADPNTIVFEHRGQKIIKNKDTVGNPKNYREKFVKFTDKRLNLLDKAKGLTKSKEAHNLINQLADDWTNSTNDPKQAYGHMIRLTNYTQIPDKVRQYLKDNWYQVEGTWATVDQTNND
jgi:hypothetical protein